MCKLNMVNDLWKAGFPVINMIWELVRRGMACNTPLNLGTIRIGDSVSHRQSKAFNHDGDGEEYRNSASRLFTLLFEPQASAKKDISVNLP